MNNRMLQAVSIASLSALLCLGLASCGSQDFELVGKDPSGQGGARGSGADSSEGPLPESPASDYEIPGILYYVDAVGGSDDAAGTSEAPFKTLLHALETATGGDGILLRDGDYGDLEFGANPNTPIFEVFDDWVTIKPDEGHSPILGRVDLGIWNRNGYLLPFSEVGNSDLRLRLDGLVIENQLQIKGSRYVEIRNCEVHTDAALEELTASGSCLDVLNGQYVSLIDNDVSHCGVGVTAMTTDFVMSGNDVHHGSHDAMKVYGGYNWLVEGNTFRDFDDGLTDEDPDPDGRNNHADGIHMHTVIHQGQYDNPRWAGGGGNVVFRGNTFYHLEAMAVMVNQNDWDGTWGDYVWENNLFGPSNGRLFILGSSFTSVSLRHNTVLYAPGDVWTSMFGREMRHEGLTNPHSAAYHVQIWGNPTGSKHYNNIFLGVGESETAGLVQDEGVVANNISLGPDDLTSLPYEAIPGNIQDYIDGGGVLGQLASDSAAVDAGTSDQDVPEVDAYQAPRDDGKPDIGAVEL